MKSRRACREAALQALYQCDVTGEYSLEAVESCFSHFCSHDDSSHDVAAESGCRELDLSFSRALASGVLENMKAIDDQIGLASTNWSIARMPRVDRTILRIAVYELLFCPGVPPKVTINEAIEIAKRFSADDAPTFVNGVLDKVLSMIPARIDASPEGELNPSHGVPQHSN